MNLLKNLISHLSIILLICSGCFSQLNILTPVENSELRNISDKLIYEEIVVKDRKNVIFNGAYEGFQCSPEINDIDAFLEEEDFNKYKASNCTCYDYKVITEQGIDLYIGFENGYYLNTRVCFDTSNLIIEHPKIDNIKLATINSKTKHIDLSRVELITKNEVGQNSKFGKFPVLVYQTNQNRLIWKAERHIGKFNVTLHHFDIDAETGQILRKDTFQYKRSFWKWIGGTGM